MSNRSQAELETQLHQRRAQVESATMSPQQAFGNMEEWVIQLGQRKAFLRPDRKQWMWYDRLHDYWVAAGCGADEAILLTEGKLAGFKKLPQPDEVGGWCVYQQEQKLYGPVRTEELLDKLKSQEAPMNILVWSPLATTWLSVVHETGAEISFCDAAGNRISVTVKGEAAPAPAPKSPKHSSPRKRSSTLTDVMSPAPASVNSSADATLIESRPVSVEIIVLSGELENQRFPVGDQLRLGREADNDLTLPDEKASRHHAILQRQGVVYQIIDLNSGNGTYVNGKRITDPTLLKNGDILLIGDTKLTIRVQ